MSITTVPFIWAVTVLAVVFHAKVVTHFVSHGGGQQAHCVRVPHIDSSRELVGADGAFQGFADYPTLKLHPCQQLSVVIGMEFQQLFLKRRIDFIKLNFPPSS